jgi:SP family general alpha glucoside:H+ symporter-like MFS transporter
VIGRVGRRPLYLAGIGLMGFFMLLIGIVGSIPSDNTAIGIGVMLVIIRITFKVCLFSTGGALLILQDDPRPMLL